MQRIFRRKAVAVILTPTTSFLHLSRSANPLLSSLTSSLRFFSAQPVSLHRTSPGPVPTSTLKPRITPSTMSSSVLHKNVIQPGQESNVDSFMGEYSKKASEQKVDLYLLVTAAPNPTTGKPWCPDCVSAEPVVEKAFSGELASKAILVVSPVERNSYKGIPTQQEQACEDGVCKPPPKHPYKTHEGLKITAIPTLYKWDIINNKPVDRLVEEDVYDQTKFDRFVGL